MTLSRILEAVCDAFDVSPGMVKDSTRKAHVVEARHAFAYLAHEAGYTLKIIGRHVNRDHSTIIHGIRRATEFVDTDGVYASKIAVSRNKLNSKNGSKIMAKRYSQEHHEQVMLIKWCRTMARQKPDYGKIFAIPNGGLRSRIIAAKMTGEGVVAGVPDLLLPVARLRKHGLFIKMKAPATPNSAKGRPTKEQEARVDQLNADGYCAVFCYGFDEARKTMEWYLS